MAQGRNTRLHYDKEKDLNGIAMEPRLLSMHENYDPMDYGTWPSYEAACTVAPRNGSLADRTAIWCTKKATYVFTIYKQHWDTMYFVANSSEYIRDSKTGKKYYAKEHVGAPLDVTYWIYPVRRACRQAYLPPSTTHPHRGCLSVDRAPHLPDDPYL